MSRIVPPRWLPWVFCGVAGGMLSQWAIDSGYRQATVAAIGLFVALAGMGNLNIWLRRTFLPAASIFLYAPALFAGLAAIAVGVATLLRDDGALLVWGGAIGLAIGVADQLGLLVRHLQARRSLG